MMSTFCGTGAVPRSARRSAVDRLVEQREIELRARVRNTGLHVTVSFERFAAAVPVVDVFNRYNRVQPLPEPR